MAGFDLEQFRASQAEIQKATFPVRLGSEKVTVDDDGHECEPYERDVMVYVPDPNDWSLDAQMKLAQGDLAGWIAMVVGADNLDLFLSYGWTNREFKALNDAVAEWSGFTPGPSSPGPPGRASTRTSN